MALTKIGKEGITGISNSADANVITIDSNEDITITKQGFNTTSLNFANSSNSTVGALKYDHNSGRMLFDVHGSERMRIGADGKFSINGTDAGSSHVTIYFASASYSALASQMTDNGSGAGFLVCRKSDGSTIGQVARNGTSDAVQFLTSSDYRLKENVSYNFDATAQLKQLKPCTFTWINDESNATHQGFLAHEVQDIVPYAVNGTKDAVDEDGNIEAQSIDKSDLVPLLVKTIQELEARITALENA
jgi:hypothetical protein